MPIRRGKESDVQDVARLLQDLGYPATSEQVSRRLRAILARDDYCVLVAESGSALVAVGSAHVFPSLHAEPVALLTALVVGTSSRGTGWGRSLVAGLEEFALAHGCDRILVTTANHRSGAHAFYEKLGYSLTGRRYAKQLPIGSTRPA